MKHYKLLVLLLPLLGIVSSCSDELEGNRLRPSEQLCFTASLGSNSAVLSPTTRGTAGHLSFMEEEWTLKTTATTEASTRATLVEQLAGKTQIVGYNKSNTKIFDAPFTFDADKLTSDPPIYWKSFSTGGQVSVYAYAPTSLSVTDCSFVCSIDDTDAAVNQPDIIVAKRVLVTGEFRKLIPLTFTHALTAIRFQLGDDIEAEDIQSITLSGVYKTGKYTIGETWTEQKDAIAYTPTVGDILMMIPQTLSDDAKVELTYKDGTTISISIAGRKWEAGKLITYTLHKSEQPEYVYFDLAAGNVTINNTGYSGKVYVAGEAKDVSGEHNSDNIYYVYQSSTSTGTYDKSHTGYATESDFERKVNCRIPNYDPVRVPDGRLWSDFITNNTSVEEVIETWDDGKNIRADQQSAPDEERVNTAVVRDAGRTHTRNYIKVEGENAHYNLTIDNIYSVIQEPVNKSGAFRLRSVGGIAYIPTGNTELTVTLVGDNRMGCLHIDNNPSDKITIQGTGSLTAADTDFLTVKEVGDYSTDFGDTKGYISNFWNSAIGNNTDDNTGETVYNLYIRSGVIFAGATKTEDCTAIGGGGNGYGQVYITGGIVTAVATTAGTAIGGGMGHTAHGGTGEVHITGGNVYAYNFANQWGIASSAIGGGGSYKATGSYGTVKISEGYVYAYSALGTAIGGGSSGLKTGGGATIEITGGTVVAKSGSTVSIGGGSSCLDGGSNGVYDGGTAKVTISGNPIIRTGSVGGGTTNDSKAKIGSAEINISGTPDIQAQFVMAAGAKTPPSFEMTGGTIRNSDTADGEYLHTEKNGGAIYVEDGTCKISGGTIKECAAVNGGAIYMTGGSCTISNKAIISDNLARGGHGGAVCILNGTFKMEGEEAQITRNSAINREGIGGNGGGVYVASNAEKTVAVTIASGSVTGNTSDRLGGGICVNMTGDNSAAKVTVGTENGGDENPNISKNHTLLEGGGLYVKGSKADINIQSGYIMENTVSAYVANENVANEGGMVTLEGGEVTHVVVTFNANGGNETDVTQNIVTATNSLLNAPTFTRTGYTFTGWNTRADGRGTSYTNGQVMNITTDLTLYAQWKL